MKKNEKNFELDALCKEMSDTLLFYLDQEKSAFEKIKKGKTTELTESEKMVFLFPCLPHTIIKLLKSGEKF